MAGKHRRTRGSGSGSSTSSTPKPEEQAAQNQAHWDNINQKARGAGQEIAQSQAAQAEAADYEQNLAGKLFSAMLGRSAERAREERLRKIEEED